MRIAADATCLSWIPPQAVQGAFKLPFGLGIAHYDRPPPDTAPDVDALLKNDAVRFANHLHAWIDTDRAGRITAHGMTGHGRLGSTTVRLGSHGLTFAAVALPDLAHPPQVYPDRVRFTHTAGGHTGAPVPRAVPRPPYWQIDAPLAWSTIALTLHADGSIHTELDDASPFPRHYLYDSAGALIAKSALIRYKDWLRRSAERNSPWSGVHTDVPVSGLKSPAERSLADALLVGGHYRRHRLPAGRPLSDRPITPQQVHLLLDGLLSLEVDQEAVIEVGPGAVFDPTLRTAESKRRVTVRALTPCRLAVLDRHRLDADALLKVATEQTASLRAHSRELRK